MKKTSEQQLSDAGAAWLAARETIAKFFVELFPSYERPNMQMPDETYAEHNAAAILARLASMDRPMIVVFADELEE